MIIMDMNTIVNKHFNAPVSDQTFSILSNESESTDYQTERLIEKPERNPNLRHLRSHFSNQLNSSTESFHSSITSIADCVSSCDGDDFLHHHHHHHTDFSFIDQFDSSDESNLSMLTTTTSISTTTAETSTKPNLMFIHSGTVIGFVDNDGEDLNVLDSIVDEEFTETVRFQTAKKSKLFNCQVDDHHHHNHNNNNSASTSTISITSSSSAPNDKNHINSHIEQIPNNNNDNNETDYLHSIITSFSLANHHHHHNNNNRSCSSNRFDKNIDSVGSSSNSSSSSSPSPSSPSFIQTGKFPDN